MNKKTQVQPEIKPLDRRLRHFQKLETVGTLASGIAHDFNNILGAIMLNAELALEDVEKKSETAYALTQILEASHRAKILIEQILTFSRSSDNEKIPFKINVVVKETIKMMKSMLPATIQIKAEIPYNIGTILVNPVDIQQLVVNLCTNAAFTMDNLEGFLTISIKNTSLRKSPAKSPNLQPGHYVKLSVSDSGKGITKKDLKHIFEPSFTTQKNNKSNSLGLSVAHDIVNNHNGTITIESTLNKGTTISAFFPIIKGNSSRKKKKSSSHPKKNKQILFVDDEISLCDVGFRMLTRMGHTVTVCASGEDALREFKKQKEKFDLVITDMTMPYMTGATLANKLLDIRSDLPIILCTGFNETISPEKSAEIGIKKFLMKPYSHEDLDTVVTGIFNDRK